MTMAEIEAHPWMQDMPSVYSDMRLSPLSLLPNYSGDNLVDLGLTEDADIHDSHFLPNLHNRLVNRLKKIRSETMKSRRQHLRDHFRQVVLVLSLYCQQVAPAL